MGQYQQWLHYREVDQQLHDRLQLLEQELAQLQQQASLLEVTSSHADNEIVQALINWQSAQISYAAQTPEVPAEAILSNGTSTEHMPVTETLAEENISYQAPAKPSSTPVSPALFAWGNLPNFDSQKMPVLQPTTASSGPLPLPSRPEADLLPEDMLSFFSRYIQPVPQPTPPGWLQQALSPNAALGKGPIDQQTLRTNRLIERWLERWGRQQPDHQQEQREDQE